MDLHIITFSSFWSLSHFILFLNCAFRHELPMNSDASRSHVLIFITKPPLRITKVKMCCGPHAVSDASGLCHTSNEILPFCFFDPRMTEEGAKRLDPFFTFFSNFENCSTSAVPLTKVAKHIVRLRCRCSCEMCSTSAVPLLAISETSVKTS